MVYNHYYGVTKERISKLALLTIAVLFAFTAVMAVFTPVSAKKGQGGAADRGNSLSSVATPVEITADDINVVTFGSFDYYAVNHNISADNDGYTTLVQREPARTGGESVVTEDPDQFNTAYFGVVARGAHVPHKGQVTWYYEVDEGEWVSLTAQFNGKGELLHVNGVNVE